MLEPFQRFRRNRALDVRTSREAVSNAAFRFRYAGPAPAAISLNPITSIAARIARQYDPNTRRRSPTPCTSRTCRHTAQILSASRLSSSSAPALNPHNARCSAGAQFPATSCLGAFRPPATSSRGSSRDSGVRKPAQSTKSLRSSPLRGSKSREAGSRLRV